MLKPEEMCKLNILGPKSLSYDIIDRLHQFKIYHIVDHKKTEDLDIGSPIQNSEEISELLVKIRAIASLLNIDYGQKSFPKSKLRFSEAKSRINNLNDTLINKNSEIKSNEEKIRKLKETESILEKISLVGLDMESFFGSDSIDYLIGIVDDIKGLNHDLRKLKGRHHIYSSSLEKRHVVAIFFDRQHKQKISDVLSTRGFTEIDVAFIKEQGLKGKSSQHLKETRAKMREMQKEVDSLNKELWDLKWEWYDYLCETEDLLKIESDKTAAPLRFGATDEVFVITGWVPAKQLKEVQDKINKTVNNKVYMTAEKAKEEDTVPIKLKNPSFVKPFEWFMDLYTLPRYKEIDPTFLMFLTFPLFYGFMLGDIGYGIITLALFLILRKKIKGDFNRMINAMIFASISTMVFGALFGEVFGLEMIMGYELPHIISRAHDTQQLMIIAVAIGVVHVNIGLLVGFYNELRAHGFTAAVFEKISWILLEISAATIAWAYMDGPGLHPMPWVGFVLLALSVIMIYKGEGAKGLVEIPALFSHMLSYARLMAVGLASVILAMVINDLAGELFLAGIAGIIGGIILLVVGHTINIGLGLISPFLHSLRLHYVEFFTKFYKGGGMRYVPFGAEKE